MQAAGAGAGAGAQVAGATRDWAHAVQARQRLSFVPRAQPKRAESREQTRRGTFACSHEKVTMDVIGK